jgi:hypothetical protein
MGVNSPKKSLPLHLKKRIGFTFPEEKSRPNTKSRMGKTMRQKFSPESNK